MCFSNSRKLSMHAWSRKTHFVSAVVVQADPFHHRIDAIARCDRIRQPLQHHNSGTIIKHRPLGLRIKGPTTPIRREHSAFLIQITRILGRGNGHSTCQGHITLMRRQALKCLNYGHQGRRTCGIDTKTRPSQIKLIRRACCEEILFVGQHGLECAQPIDNLGPPTDVSLKVGVLTRPRIQANLPRKLLWRIAHGL